jgi:hypothetical protein
MTGGKVMNQPLKYLILSLALILIISSIAYADEPKTDSLTNPYSWKKSLNAGLTLSQNSYSNNWTGGEAGNIAWVALANGTFEKQTSPIFNFRNTSNLQFGQTHQQDKVSKAWNRPQKTSDKIDLDNLGRFTLHIFIDPFVAFRFQSEFLDDSYSPLKRMINPILLTESAGIARMIFQKGKNQVITRLGFAFRQNLDRAIPATSADTLAKNTKLVTANDGGLESVTDAQYNLASNISYTGKLTIFKAVFFSKKNDFKGTPAANYWKAVDFNFENTIVASLTKLVAVNIYTQLLYDKEISLKGRFKETFGLGLTFKMI